MSGDGGSGPRRRSVGFSYEGLTETSCKSLKLFVEKPPPRMLCDIGKGVLNEPMINKACRHQYCKMCIMEMIKTSLRCPVSGCPERVAQHMLHPLDGYSNEIQQLHVRCVNQDKGCTWIGPLGDTDTHMRSCKQLLPITCEMCKQRVPRNQMAEHATSSCPKLPAVCSYCGIATLAATVAYHISYECPKSPKELPFNPPPREMPMERERSKEQNTLSVPSFNPKASPRGSILRKACWGAKENDMVIVDFEDRKSSVESDGVSPTCREANDNADYRRLKKASFSKVGKEDQIADRAIRVPDTLELSTYSSCLPSENLHCPTQTRKVGSPTPSFDLWEKIENVKNNIDGANANPDATLLLLLSAVTSLQDRVQNLESENENLKGQLEKRRPLASPNSPIPSPGLVPLKLGVLK